MAGLKRRSASDSLLLTCQSMLEEMGSPFRPRNGGQEVGQVSGSPGAAQPEEENRWRAGTALGEEGAEVGVCGSDDSVLLGGCGDDRVVVCGGQVDVARVDDVVAGGAEQGGEGGERFWSTRNFTQAG